MIGRQQMHNLVHPNDFNLGDSPAPPRSTTPTPVKRPLPSRRVPPVARSPPAMSSQGLPCSDDTLPRADDFPSGPVLNSPVSGDAASERASLGGTQPALPPGEQGQGDIDPERDDGSDDGRAEDPLFNKSFSAPSSDPPSTPPSSSSSKLTSANLARLDAQSGSSGIVSVGTNSTASASSKMDPGDKLDVYSIYLPGICSELPEDILHLVERFKQGRVGPPSPNAKNVVELAPVAAAMPKERDGIDVLMPYLLVRGKEVFPSADRAMHGIEFLAVRAEANLEEKYLPPPRAESYKYRPLEKPRPDYIMGYIPLKDAMVAKVKSPFTSDEEFKLFVDPVTSHVHFPFISQEWKSSSNSHAGAQLQAAKGGASCVRFHQTFFAASDAVASAADCAHVSITVNTESVYVYLHFNHILEGRLSYHMEVIDKGFVNNLEDITRFRALLHNILDWAMGDRLLKIKSALSTFKPERLEACRQGLSGKLSKTSIDSGSRKRQKQNPHSARDGL